uniref:Ig-like domain-containing protein n=1 Tax=Pelodiscus sinensis TaxID=13735 RepID=K7FZ58_PELSI
GATVYLNPTLSIPETYQQINWWFNDSLKILIKKLNQPASYPSDYFNENKLHYHGNRTLEIRQLQKQDSSIYKMDVEDSQGRTEKENIQLDVYEPVPEPSVEVDFRANQDGWCNVTLVCNVDATQVAYSWYQDGKYYMGKNSRTLDIGFKLQSDTTYKCIISNHISEAAGVIYYRSPCT